jgi:hypothetical protein
MFRMTQATEQRSTGRRIRRVGLASATLAITGSILAGVLAPAAAWAKGYDQKYREPGSSTTQFIVTNTTPYDLVQIMNTNPGLFENKDGGQYPQDGKVIKPGETVHYETITQYTWKKDFVTAKLVYDVRRNDTGGQFTSMGTVHTEWIQARPGGEFRLPQGHSGVYRCTSDKDIACKIESNGWGLGNLYFQIAQGNS